MVMILYRQTAIIPLMVEEVMTICLAVPETMFTFTTLVMGMILYLMQVPMIMTQFNLVKELQQIIYLLHIHKAIYLLNLKMIMVQ